MARHYGIEFFLPVANSLKISLILLLHFVLYFVVYVYAQDPFHSFACSLLMHKYIRIEPLSSTPGSQPR